MNLTRFVNRLLDAPTIPAPRTVKAETGSSVAAILGAQVRAAPYGGNQDVVDTDAAYKLALVTTWVASALQLISNRVTAAGAQLKVQRGRGKEAQDIEDHPLLALLDRPNSFMSGTFLRKYTVYWRKLRGNAYWFLGTSAPGRGEIQEILPLQANLVRPMPHTLHVGRGVFAGQPTIDYEYNVGGELMTLPGENIVHFREPNPFDFWEGLSPLTGAILAIELDYAQKVWQRDFFKEENAIPSSILSMPQEIGEPDFQRIVASVKAQLDSGMKRLFTRAGDLSVNVISQTLEQMQILESRKFTRDEIDRAFLIPEGVFSGSTSGDSRLGADISLARNAIQPLIDDDAMQISLDVLPYYGDDDTHVVAPNIVPQDRALEVQEYTIYSQELTINENRKVRGETEWKPPQGMEALADLGNVPVRILPMAQTVMAAAATPEGDASKGADILGYHIEQGIVTRNEARADVGLPPVDDTEEGRLRDMRAKLEVMALATSAGIAPEDAIRMVGLDTMLPENSETLKPEPEPPVNPPPPAQPNAQPGAPDPPDTGTLPGSQDPEAMVEEMAGKGVAWRAEAKQFRKWARGRLPEVDASQFQAAVLSEADKAAILAELEGGIVPDFFTKTGTLTLDEIKAMLLQLDRDDDEAEHKLKRKLEARSERNIRQAFADMYETLFPTGSAETDPNEIAAKIQREFRASQALQDAVTRAVLEASDLGVSISFDQLSNVGRAFDWSLVHAEARDWAEQHSGALITQIDNTTQKLVQQSVARWIANGEGLEWLIRDLEPAFGRRRSEAIAATETTTASAMGSLRGYRASGVVAGVEWQGANDERMCPRCGSRIGKRAPLNNPQVDGYGIPAHTNCRCWWLPVLSEIS